MSPRPPRDVLRRDDPLRRAVALLEVDRRRVLLAVLAGTAGLGSAVGLAAVSAWLIARASQMPPVMYLTIAAVSVRALGISRGVLRYVERLVSHDVALRGMATLRVRLYERLAAGDAGALVALRRGDLLARVGADVDSVGDVVVRGLLPVGVAATLGVGSVVLVGAFLPEAGLALALCLLLAGVVAPWWSVRATREAETRSAQARADMAATTLTLLDGAGELAVAGRTGQMLGHLRRADRDLADASDRAARPAAVSAALLPLAIGLAVLAALVLGIPATTAGRLAPVELAVVVLTPLAAFEAVSMLPAAGVQLLRSRQAARRITELLDAAGGEPSPAGGPVPRGGRGQAAGAPGTPEVDERPAADGARDAGPARPGAAAGTLVARGLACGWPGRAPVLRDLDLTVGPGRSVAIVGPSGVGKTTLLLTLAGVLPPVAGEVRAGGDPVHALTRSAAARRVALTTEDAHVFDTTLLENLRVGRGDVTPEEAAATLDAVGLRAWLDALPDGLETVLGADATRVSGGERRRVLLARALLGPAPVLLLDEPTEHVDAGAARVMTGLLDGSLTGGRGVVVVTHRVTGLEAADEVILLDRTGSVRARGRHRDLLGVDPDGVEDSDVRAAYRSAWTAQEQES